MASRSLIEIKLPSTFRNPSNCAETWTSRGSKSRLLAVALGAGKAAEQCRIGGPTLPDAAPTLLRFGASDALVFRMLRQGGECG